MNTIAPNTPRQETGRVAPRPEYATHWESRAACLTEPTKWDDEATVEDARAARKTCLGCPVLAECLTKAMKVEAGHGASRSGMKAGLTAAQRDRLQRAVWRSSNGTYDAEEARLLALEAEVSGRPVAQIADREGAAGVTRSLALLLAGDLAQAPRVSTTPPVSAKPKRPSELAAERIEEIVAWREAGESLDEIGRRLEVSGETVRSTLLKHVGGETLSSAPPMEDLMEQIAEYRKRGLSYQAIDNLMGVSTGATCRRVKRWREKAEGGGEKPAAGLGRSGLTPEQVVEMREQARGGATDLAQSLRFGVSVSHVRKIVTGAAHRDVGGPIRAKRSGQPTLESRLLWGGGQAAFLKGAA